MRNQDLELIVTSDVGPRVIRCGFVGGSNLFVELPGHLGKSGEPWWMLRGGHRLWIAPEVQPHTYALDNSPVQVTHAGCQISLLQAIEAETSLQKQISIALKSPSEVSVSHQVKNCGPTARVVAPWALTALAPGGVAITMFPPRTSHSHQLQPTNPLVMWSYTDFTDSRWTFLSKYLVLRQDPTARTPQKIGLFSESSFSCYLLGTVLFVKRSTAFSNATYPDFQSSVELFTNENFLELETLGPMIELEPNCVVEHLEVWSILRDVHISEITEAELDRVLLPLVQQLS